jgi:hypothetical protein
VPGAASSAAAATGCSGSRLTRSDPASTKVEAGSLDLRRRRR